MVKKITKDMYGFAKSGLIIGTGTVAATGLGAPQSMINAFGTAGSLMQPAVVVNMGSHLTRMVSDIPKPKPRGQKKWRI